MKLRRFLAAAVAAAVVTSAMAVTTFAASYDTVQEVTITKADNCAYFPIELLDGITFDSITIEGQVDASQGWTGGGGAVGFDAADDWAQVDFTPESFDADGNFTVTLDMGGKTANLDKEDAVLMIGWWWGSGDGSLKVKSVSINGKDVMGLPVADAPADEPAADDTTVDAPAEDTTTDVPTDDVVVEAPAALTLEECYNGGTIVLIDDKGGNAYATANGLDILDVYGYRVTAQFPMAEVSDEAFWIGGGIGANSNSTGWASTEWGKASGAKPIVAEFDEQGVTTLELLSDASIFAADDAFAQLWIQSWGGTMNIISVELLAADGTAIAEAVVGEIAPVEDAPVADDTVVDTEAPSTDAGKDSPDTGVEGIAAVAGVVALAGVAVVASRKRK